MDSSSDEEFDSGSSSDSGGFRNKEHILQSLRPTNDLMDRNDVSVLVLECPDRTDDEQQHQLSATNATAATLLSVLKPSTLPLVPCSASDEDMNQPSTNRAL